MRNFIFDGLNEKQRAFLINVITHPFYKGANPRTMQWHNLRRYDRQRIEDLA